PSSSRRRSRRTSGAGARSSATATSRWTDMESKAKVGRRKAKGLEISFSLFPFLFSLCCVLTGTAAAQAFPSKPVRVVVGFSAGGATDLSARFLAAKLLETLGQQVVVDDRPGAASMLA